MLYKVLVADNITKLAKLLEDLLNRGWAPIGGIRFASQLYLQPLTRS